MRDVKKNNIRNTPLTLPILKSANFLQPIQPLTFNHCSVHLFLRVIIDSFWSSDNLRFEADSNSLNALPAAAANRCYTCFSPQQHMRQVQDQISVRTEKVTCSFLLTHSFQIVILNYTIVNYMVLFCVFSADQLHHLSCPAGGHSSHFGYCWSKRRGLLTCGKHLYILYKLLQISYS